MASKFADVQPVRYVRYTTSSEGGSGNWDTGFRDSNPQTFTDWNGRFWTKTFITEGVYYSREDARQELDELASKI